MEKLDEVFGVQCIASSEGSSFEVVCVRGKKERPFKKLRLPWVTRAQLSFRILATIPKAEDMAKTPRVAAKDFVAFACLRRQRVF